MAQATVDLCFDRRIEVLKYYLTNRHLPSLNAVEMSISEIYLRNGERRSLGHLPVRTEEGVALESVIFVCRDESKHTVVRCVCRAIGDPDKREFEAPGCFQQSPVD